MRKHLNPCKDCTDRQIGCHSTCQKYEEYAKLNEQQKQQLREIKALDGVLNSYEHNKAKRLKKQYTK